MKARGTITRTILEQARSHAVRAINAAMVQAYWEIGLRLIEEEQRGEARAEYGTDLIAGISERLTERFGRGFSKQNLWRMRQFYVTFPEGSAVRDPRIVAALRRQSEGEPIVAALRRQSAMIAQFLSTSAGPTTASS